MFEQMLTFPDDRKDVLEMCLAAPSTGDYKPIDLPGLKADSAMVASTISNQSSRTSSRKHVPGRAGGGWESSSEEEELSSDKMTVSVDEIAQEACEESEDETERCEELESFLNRPQIDPESLNFCCQR